MEEGGSVAAEAFGGLLDLPLSGPGNRERKQARLKTSSLAFQLPTSYSLAPPPKGSLKAGQPAEDYVQA